MTDDGVLGADLGHPRPQLQRLGWAGLDGRWDFADDPDGVLDDPHGVDWGDSIVVPFAPETPASGVGDRRFRQACWYRRALDLPALDEGERLVLHFGAVDYAADVWLDGYPLGRHEGGYTAFEVDLTAFAGSGPHELVVRAQDDPADLAKPRGKQDWELEAHAIWYPRTTGIWQSVWLERLPRSHVSSLHWTSDLDRYEVRMEARLGGVLPPGTRVRARLSYQGRELVDDLIGVHGRRLERGFQLDGTGVDTLRDELTWSPHHPALVDAVVEVLDSAGVVVDRVHSYTGIRTVAVRAGRFVLNGRPFPLRLVLDQGYWPETGLTPPSTEALRRDVELAKAMGFNGVRKHQKIEDPRYLAWADRLGLVVWTEMPPAYRFDNEAVRRTVREWTEAVERDRSHPCVVAWVPFNESTGTLSLPTRADQRHYVESMALLTKALDPTRLVVSNDGWENLGGEIIGVHDYDPDPERLARRYSSEFTPDTLTRFARTGRIAVLDDPQRPVLEGALSDGARALVLSECGGVGFLDTAPAAEDADPLAGGVPEDRLTQPAAWGYSMVESGTQLLRRYAELIAAVTSVERIAGFCYTQFADTYQEVNGLLRADRAPKAPLDAIHRATRGAGWPAAAPAPDE
jgi:hypothetical protein